MRTVLQTALLLLSSCAQVIVAPAPKPPVPDVLLSACPAPVHVPLPPPVPRTVKALGEFAKEAQHAALANAVLLDLCEHNRIAGVDILTSP